MGSKKRIPIAKTAQGGEQEYRKEKSAYLILAQSAENGTCQFGNFFGQKLPIWQVLPES
jgi:hypothetical protein